MTILAQVLKAKTETGERSRRYAVAVALGAVTGLFFIALTWILTSLSARILTHVKDFIT